MNRKNEVCAGKMHHSRCVDCGVKLKKYKNLIENVKFKCKSEWKNLKDWQRNRLHESALKTTEMLALKESMNGSLSLKRIEYSAVKNKEFKKKWEDRSIPVIITSAMQEWPAFQQESQKWTIKNLLKKYPNEKFKVGEDDDEKVVYMALKYYLHYALCDLTQGAVLDDSPLYIFDASFGKRNWHHSARRPCPKNDSANNRNSGVTTGSRQSDSGSNDESSKASTLIGKKRKRKMHKYDPFKSQAPCHLVEDYTVPLYFQHDLFMHVGGRRPPFRWIVIGPARSGTGIHIDPLGTSAWNALISGHKRWCLFPPTTDKKIIDPKIGDHEASTWFAKVYPKLQLPSVSNPSISVAQELGMIEAIQCPGEIMFVPGGWHHIVMNLDFAIAVTQNFCSLGNVESVYLKTRFARPKLAQKLEKVLRDPQDCKNKVTRKEMKRMRKKAVDIKGLQSVPALDTSSSNDSSSSSSTDTGTDSDAHVICQCHGRKRFQPTILDHDVKK